MRVSELLRRENNNLDSIRILLAILVIFGHSQFLNGADKSVYDPVHYFFNYTYSAAVAVKLFFFISGLVVTNSLIHKRDTVIFLLSRFFRLMPALLFVVLLTGFVLGPILTTLPLPEYFSKELYKYVERNLYFKTRFTLPGVFADNLYPNTVNGSLWSLRYEVGCYLILLAAFLLTRIKNKVYYTIPAVLVIIATLLPYGFLQKILGNDPERYLLPATFAFGVLCAINAERIKINLVTLLAAIAIYFIFRNTANEELVLIFALSIGVLYLSSRKFALRWQPKYDISYGIYLWGFLVQQTIYHYLGHLPAFGHLSLAVAISTALALATHFIVELPGIKMGKKSMTIYLNYSLAGRWKLRPK
jgi:peptidoglycan/LPS O-acetylase OafA/YrhL